jgi:RHS repeat-associated protein
MTQELSDYDPNAPQAYLVYLFFDKNMKLHSKASGMLKVSQSDVLEEHATQQLTMTEDGYFYTYVTNRSNRKVELRQLLIGAERRFRDDHPAAKQCGIDDLRIVHLQGQVRARYDYYSYGLMWNQPINPYDNTYGLKEWQMQEWGDKGIELYQFEARMYDPVLGRWHAPDPLSQFHSPYMANFNNPANFTDPDGRFSMRIGDMIVQATVQLAISISQVDIFAQISNVTIGGTLNGAQFAAGASGAISGALTVAMAICGCIEGYRDIMQASISKIVDKVMGRGARSHLASSSANINTTDQAPESLDNVVYVLVTEQGKKSLTNQGTSGQKIADQINQNMDLKKLTTRAVYWEGDPRNFDVNKMEKNRL